jgi:hypothetical protein
MSADTDDEISPHRQAEKSSVGGRIHWGGVPRYTRRNAFARKKLAQRG